MNKQDFINILENPNQIEMDTIIGLKSITSKYPYFQSARVLYLKGLKNKESFKYNNELKVTSAYTTDRTVLFDFITSDVFNESKIIPKEKENKSDEDLGIGKPLIFSRNDKHSFNQWLQLIGGSSVNEKTKTDKKPEVKSNIESDIIDKFISNNPKISRIDKFSSENFVQVEVKEEPLLMTETLAKVYLEQKKYDSAIKAYEILSLKYPEKSSIFAYKIENIKNLQKNK